MTYAASATVGTLETDQESRTLWWAVALMLLTTVHHSYGAVIYHTPWRHHASIVAVITVLLLIALLRIHRSPAHQRVGNIAFWMFVIVTLLIPVVVIGLFEGGYNHVLKDILYFTTANRSLLERLFPPPTYEMPDDAFFEITGVLQFPVGLVTGWHLVRTIHAQLRR